MLIKIFSDDKEPLDLFKHLMDEHFMDEQGLAIISLQKNSIGAFYVLRLISEKNSLSGRPRELLQEACLPYGLDFRSFKPILQYRDQKVYKLFDKAQREG